MAEMRIAVEGGLISVDNVATGSTSVADSTTATTFLTIPAGRTFVGEVTVVANSRATTAAYGTASCVVTGTGAVPPTTSAVIVAGSGRDACACTITQKLQVTAPAGNTVTLQLKNSTATTFNSSACANGQFI